MTKKPLTPRQAALKKLLSPDGTTMPPKLPKALSGQSRKRGESVFTTALNSATSDHVARAQQITGPLDSRFCAEAYQRTGNPVWQWLGIFFVSKPDEIPPEAFQYLKQVGRRFFDEVVSQAQSLERVQITPGQELQEGIIHLPADRPPSPDISEVLGLSQPGRNPFQAAASDLQALSAAVAVEDLVLRTGCSREQAYAALAIVHGRTSADAGPSTEAVRKIVRRGLKLLPKRAGNFRNRIRSVGKTDG